MPIEIEVKKEKYNDSLEMKLNDTDFLGRKAQIAVEMIGRWGMVAGMTDGEDTSGRSKLRLATEEELVKRAFKIADLMFDELELRDWMVQIPTFEMQELAVQNIMEEKENERVRGEH